MVKVSTSPFEVSRSALLDPVSRSVLYRREYATNRIEVSGSAFVGLERFSDPRHLFLEYWEFV